MNSIKDGDYFTYSWKPGFGPSTDSYWCRDRRCVARADQHGDIVLIDTYNYWPFKDREYDTDIFTYEGLAREYSKYVTEDKFDIEFICNLNDYEFIEEWEKDDYDNVVYVGYQCTKKWAKPKGAEVSNSALIKKHKDQLASAVYDKNAAESRIQWINDELNKLETAMNEYDEDVVGVVQRRPENTIGMLFEGVILATAIINEKVKHGTKLYSEDYVRDLKLQILSLEEQIDDMWMEERVRGEWDE